VHTSAITVAVLAEADEVEVKIDPKTFVSIPSVLGSRRPVGQHHLLAVRITHLPTAWWSPARTRNRRSRTRQSRTRAALASLRVGA